jgi:hypothetical protein
MSATTLTISLSVFLAFALGFILGRLSATTSKHAYQNRGEALLSHAVQTNFHPPAYHLLNHVTLKLSDGTTQIDHILISKFGVFVIETKDYKGWIFANAKQPTWTQVLFNGKFKFQNPILQNYRHLRAIEDLLDFLPAGTLKPLVVFTGEAEFKTDIPEGVFTLATFIDYLHEQTTEVMSLNRVQFCVGRIESMRLAISGETDVEHIQSLEQRHGLT